MALDLVEQQDDAAGGGFAQTSCHQAVLLPRPGKNVGQRTDTPYAGRGMQNRNCARPGRENGGNVTRVSHAEALHWTDAEDVATTGGERLQRSLHGVGIAAILILDPARPVEQQPVADGGSAALFLFPQTVPNLWLRKHVGRRAIATGETIPLASLETEIVSAGIVSQWIPNGHRTVRMSVHDQALHSRIVACPPLVGAQPLGSLIRSPPGPAKPGYDRRRGFFVARRGGKADGQLRVHVARPMPGQRPPRRIQQKCLAETVVACHKVHTGVTGQFQFRSGTGIPQLQGLEHNASVADRHFRSTTTGDLIRGRVEVDTLRNRSTGFRATAESGLRHRLNAATSPATCGPVSQSADTGQDCHDSRSRRETLERTQRCHGTASRVSIRSSGVKRQTPMWPRVRSPLLSQSRVTAAPS